MTTKLSVRLINDNTVSPLDFGAVGDGTTDDTLAVNKAIEQLASGSKILDLQNKTYKVVSQLSNISTSGVIIRNGSLKYVPNSDNKTKPMLKITVTQANTAHYSLPDVGVTGSLVYPGDKKITVDVEHGDPAILEGGYFWLEDNNFDFVYKGVLSRPEDSFARTDRGFKGEMLKLEYKDTTGGDHLYYLDNEVVFGYNGELGHNDDKGVSLIPMTVIEDITFDNVNLIGPGIVRKNLGGAGGTSPVSISGTSRLINYGSTDHGLSINEYITVDTGDYTSVTSSIQGPVQGVFKIGSDPSGNSTITTGTGADLTLEGGDTNGHSGTDAHNLSGTGDTGPTTFDTWIYTGCSIGLCVEYGVDFKMNNCKVTGFGEAGVVAYKCYEPEFSNCVFEGARPECSGGLVVANGCYKPYIHDCTFKGYNGLTLGSSRLKALIDNPNISVTYYGVVSKSIIKNNKFNVRETAIKVLDNAIYTEISDNNINLESTFAQARCHTQKYNRNLSAGIHSHGIFVDIMRNSITGVMKYGVYHKQTQKAARVGETIFEEGSAGVNDIGSYTTKNALFYHPTDYTNDNDETPQGHRGLGNEMARFYVNILDNNINARHNLPTYHISTYNNLVYASQFGVLIENKTAGNNNQPTTFATKVNIKENTIAGHLASIRLRLINGRFKGVNISSNQIDSKPYNDRTAGGAGQFTTGSTRPGVGLRGFYDDNTWEFETTAPENAAPNIYQQTQKASGLCLMIESYDEYQTKGGQIVKPRIEDIDIMNNVFTRSINWADKSPNSGHTGDPETSGSADLGGYRIGGTSVFSVYFDVTTHTAGSVRHINVSQNRIHYGAFFGWVWATRRAPAIASTSYEGSSTPTEHAAFTGPVVAYSIMNNNFINTEQLGGYKGEGWNRSDLTASLPYDQTGAINLHRIYNWNEGKNSLDSLYNSRYGLNEDYGDMEGASAGALQLDSNGAVVPKRYFGRFNNIIRWG